MKKEFDAVQMMRDIRDKLNSEYSRHPELREKRLAAIHKKYGFVTKKKRHNHKHLTAGLEL